MMDFTFCRKFFVLGAFLVCTALSGVELFVIPGSRQQINCGAAQTGLPEIPLLEPEFKLQFFKKYFKVLIKVPLLPGTEPDCSGKGNDDARIFIRDTAEFLVSPKPESGIYYHVGVNPAGFCYTARKRDVSWNPDVKTIVKKERTCWRAELIIPYWAIKTGYPQKGTKWKMNIAATVPTAGGKKSVSWSGAYDYHQISKMGTLHFSRKQQPHLAFWNTCGNNLQAELHVPVKYAAAKAVCRIDGMEYPGKRSGGSYSWKIPLRQDPVNGKDFNRVTILLLDHNRKELFRREAIAKMQTRHSFDLDSFYYTAAQKEISYTHTLPAPATITLRRTDGRLVFQGKAADRTGKIALPQPGEYVLEITSGKLRSSRYLRVVTPDFGVKKIADSAGFEIRGRTFMLGGAPVFLIGASATPKWHLQFTPAFNFRTGNGGNQKNTVNVAGPGLFKLERKPYTRYHLRPGRREKLLASTYAPAGNRGMMRLAYEGQIQITTGDKSKLQKLDNTRFFETLYRELKAKNPQRYFSLHTDRDNFLKPFGKLADIFEYASWNSSYAIDMMQNIEGDLSRVVSSAGSRPVVFWLGGSIPNGKCRTAEELRAAVYMAIALNCSGVIFHMGHGGVDAARTRIWSLISGICAEVQDIYPRFAAGKEYKDFVLSCKGNFLYSVRKNKDQICVLIVNRQGREQKLEMKTRNGFIRDRFTPFEPKVYFLSER